MSIKKQCGDIHHEFISGFPERTDTKAYKQQALKRTLSNPNNRLEVYKLTRELYKGESGDYTIRQKEAFREIAEQFHCDFLGLCIYLYAAVVGLKWWNHPNSIDLKEVVNEENFPEFFDKKPLKANINILWWDAGDKAIRRDILNQMVYETLRKVNKENRKRLKEVGDCAITDFTAVENKVINDEWEAVKWSRVYVFQTPKRTRYAMYVHQNKHLYIIGLLKEKYKVIVEIPGVGLMENVFSEEEVKAHYGIEV